MGATKLDAKRLISYNIERIFAESRLTLKQFLEVADLPSSSFSNYRTGKFTPNINTLEKLADRLSVPIAEFFRDPDGMLSGVSEKRSGVDILSNDSNPISVMQRLMVSVSNGQSDNLGIKVSTRNMEPFASAGDTVCFQFAAAPIDGKVYLVVCNGRIIPCRAKKEGYIFRYTPLCKSVEPFKASAKSDSVSIIGEVNAVIHVIS